MTRSEYRTLGRLAAESGGDFFALQKAAKGVRPSFALNGTAYYGTAACRRILAAARAPSSKPARPPARKGVACAR